jgi:OmpA-OmpF porin, OOP family
MNRLIDAVLLATVSGGLLCAQGTAQPDLKAVKIDFVPGEKTVYFDDFSDMAEDEPPPHWALRNGKVELRKGEGIRQMTTVCPGKPSLNSASFTFPKNFTTEIEAVFGGASPDMAFFAWPKGVDGGETPSWRIDISPQGVSVVGPKDEKVGSQTFNPPLVNQVMKVALWVQDGRARAYVNGERIADVNQMVIPPDVKPADHWTLRERCDRPTDGWIGLRSIRVAESAPDPSVVFSSTGKLVTHGIMFDTDSDRLKVESAPVMKAIVRALDKNPNLKLEIDGYTDSTGNAQHNEDLSKKRAEAVKSVLVSQFQVDAARLTSNGFGAGKPIASNDTADGRAQNRRVEFVKQ